MRISYKTLVGAISYVDVNSCESIDAVKEKISLQESIALSQVRLIFRGAAVEGGTLKDNGIGNGDEVMLVIKEVSTIQIKIQVENGRAIVVNVEPGELVENFKIIIQEKLGFAASEQTLLNVQGRVISGGRLNQHRIENGSTLTLRLKKMNVFVSGWDGKNHTFQVSSTDTVDTFKSMVHGKTGVPASQQRLQYQGRQLESGRLLSYYNLVEAATIQMVGRLRGG